jgi:hypothetical protein
MRFFYVSNAQCINLEQITLITDGGKQIEVNLSDGKYVAITDADKVAAFRLNLGLKS